MNVKEERDRARLLARNLFAMIPRETWSEHGAGVIEGHDEGLYRASLLEEEIRSWAAAPVPVESEIPPSAYRRGSLSAAAQDERARVAPDETLREALRDVAAAAWGYRVAYEAYWGEDVPGSALPIEQKQRHLEALVRWQQELDAALSALDDTPGDFKAAIRDNRATVAKAIGEALRAATPAPYEGSAREAADIAEFDARGRHDG